MSISISRQDKSLVIDLLRKLLLGFLIPHINREYRDGVINHLAWMDTQRTPMNVKCTFQTVPELRLTRITFEVGFEPIPEAKP